MAAELVMQKYPLADKRCFPLQTEQNRKHHSCGMDSFLGNIEERDISMYAFPSKHLLQLPLRFISSVRFGAKTGGSVASVASWSVCFCLGYYYCRSVGNGEVMCGVWEKAWHHQFILVHSLFFCKWMRKVYMRCTCVDAKLKILCVAFSGVL